MTETTTPDRDMTYGEPPAARTPTGGGNPIWEEAAARLIETPGQWARINSPYSTAPGASGRVGRIRRSEAPGYRDATFDARYEKAGEREFYVWAVCLSPDAPGASDHGPADGPVEEVGPLTSA